jgi:hypothetical protein
VNLSECATVLTLIEGLWDHYEARPGQPQAWASALCDVPVEAVLAAVVRLSRTEARAPSVAAIRGSVAESAGLLPVGAQDAFSLAQAVAVRDGVGRLMLPPLVRRFYDEFGGAGGQLRSSSSAVRAQFRDAYAAARDREVLDVLAGDLGGRLALAAADRAAARALPAAAEEPA